MYSCSFNSGSPIVLNDDVSGTWAGDPGGSFGGGGRSHSGLSLRHGEASLLVARIVRFIVLLASVILAHNIVTVFIVVALAETDAMLVAL